MPDSPARQPPTGPTTIYSRANLVVVDVVVTDKKGASVHHLRREDFVVLDSDKPQTMNSFEEHTAPSSTEAAKVPAMPVLPRGIFTNFSPAPESPAVNILLFDALNTSRDDQPFARAQLAEYIQHAPVGTRTAIFGLTTQLHMLQGFTSDPAILKQVITKSAGETSPLLSNLAGNQFSDSLGAVSGVPGAAEAAAAVDNLQQINGSFAVVLRARYTLNAMNVLARYLANIPGRKNLIWFSGSFPLTLQPNASIEASDPYAGTTFENEYRDTVALLTRGRVAVYPVDSRGLITDPVFSAASAGPDRGFSPTSQLKVGANFSHQLAEEHATMQSLARDTGGRAFYNGNNLAKATAEAIEEGSNFYTLTYTPSDPRFNNAYRKTEVKLLTPGYTLSYRRGYYASDPDAKSSPRTVVAAGKTQPDTSVAAAIQSAMIHGVPGPTQILFKVRALPVKGVFTNAGPLNTVTPAGVAEAHDRFRQYVVDFDVASENIVFTPTSNGMLRCNVEFAGLVYQPDGVLTNAISSRLSATITAAQRNAILRSGLPFRLQVGVPDHGTHSIRVGIRDLTSERIGSLEFPVAALDTLPAIDPPPPPAAPTGATRAAPSLQPKN